MPDDPDVWWTWRRTIAGAVVAAILPGVAAAIYLCRKDWLWSAGIGLAWLVAFSFLAVILHRLRRVHIGVSAGGAAATVGTVFVACAMGDM